MALLVAAACSSGESASIGAASPAPLSGDVPSTPSPTSSPGGTPDRDPCATETNFITLVCVTDADCAPVGYCEPWPAADAGEQLVPELAAATGPAGAAPACVDPAASDLAASSGPAEAASAAPTELAAPAEGTEQAADAGAWRPVGRCILY